ncbi:polysaccharide deacetylase family protein [Thalassobacillus sp. CUG 92003]|uniref:polysaccharide deacetylase family protein n=1 Tax=Thalassobacillus sp. CUG 92003 TaxID=2736641 RepID=UPI0015E7DC27|nr:polysaccharide deacetylase family protein [Thalassobacillus sp. CUG 92003]
MKQSLVYITVTMLMILGSCSYLDKNNQKEVTATGHDKAAPFEINIESKIEEYPDYHLAVHYPETSNDQINQRVKDYVNQQISEFKKESYNLKQEAQTDRNYELNIDFSVVYLNDQFFVVQFDNEKKYGQDKTESSKKVMNFDRDKGKQLVIEDFFRDGNTKAGLQALSKAVQKRMTEEDALAEAEYSWVSQGTKPTSANFDNIALKENEIVVHFNPSQIASAAAGPVTIAVPKSELEAELADRFIGIGDSESPTTGDESEESEVDNEITTDSVENNSGDKQVALAFEDGPDPTVTRDILSVLDQYKAKGTFFMLGKRVSFYPELTKQVASEGHEIGNHSWSHKQLDHLPEEEIKKEVKRTNELIKKLTDKTPSFVRPPYETLNEKLKNAIDQSIVGDAIKVNDPQNSAHMARSILDDTENGRVIMLPALSSITPEALDIILRELSVRGYTFVTVSELKQKNHK